MDFVWYSIAGFIIALVLSWLFQRYCHLLNRRQGVSSEEKSLREARRISEVFRDITAPPVLSAGETLTFEVPVPSISSLDQEIAQLNGFAEEMANAEEDANLLAQIAQEAVRGADEICESRERTLRAHQEIEERRDSLHEKFSKRA